MGMVHDYSKRRKIVVDMTDYIKDMLGEFPVKFKDKDRAATPAADHLFEAGKGRRLDCNRAEMFHTVVMKDCSYRSEHDRIYIQQSRYYVRK